ncbi:MAG: hemin uptake protein HemP [Pseudomonadota bacterium]
MAGLDDKNAPGYEAPARPPLHEAQELTKGGNLAFIRLNNQIYTLRITRANKLILTK